MRTRDITQEEIDSVKGLIMKKAIESWRKLPRKTQCYIDIQDMFNDGVVYVTYLLGRPHKKWKYDKKKGKLSTILWFGLENFYRRCAEQLNAVKRFDGFDQSLDWLRGEHGFDVSSVEEEAEIREHIRTVFLATYADASDGLRESMRKWFLQMDSTKIHVRSQKFLRDKAEFKPLAQKYGLDATDCRVLMHNAQIRNEVISRLPEYRYIEV